MPVATISRCVLASSQDACTSALRPRLSGIHSAAYPHSSTRLANAADAAALVPSNEIQTPSFPSFIVRLSMVVADGSVNRPICCVHPPLALLPGAAKLLRGRRASLYCELS